MPNFGHLFNLSASADRNKGAVQRTSYAKDVAYCSTHSHKIIAFYFLCRMCTAGISNWASLVKVRHLALAAFAQYNSATIFFKRYITENRTTKQTNRFSSYSNCASKQAKPEQQFLLTTKGAHGEQCTGSEIKPQTIGKQTRNLYLRETSMTWELITRTYRSARELGPTTNEIPVMCLTLATFGKSTISAGKRDGKWSCLAYKYIHWYRIFLW